MRTMLKMTQCVEWHAVTALFQLPQNLPTARKSLSIPTYPKYMIVYVRHLNHSVDTEQLSTQKHFSGSIIGTTMAK